MSKKRIFIGSATESKRTAEAFAKSLSEVGFAPARWWEEFPPGSFTFDRLLEISKTVDAAVFLCTADDQIWYRDEAHPTPRDNVILEYGLFAAQLGRERTVVVAGHGVKLPSDISSITHVKLAKDWRKTAERLVKHFLVKLLQEQPAKPESVLVIVDPDVSQKQVSDPLPATWRERTLYFGSEGAKAWLNAVNEDGYIPKDHHHKIERALIACLDKLNIRTFVSFGPGDGETDRRLVARLKSRDPWLQYIPIDISDGLLQRSIKVVGEEVVIPIGILGDFEDRTAFIGRQLLRHTVSTRLFCLLGNTLGNLDVGEHNFVENARNLMTREDYLLIEVSLIGPNWSKFKDQRLRHESYNEGYRRFICHGIARRNRDSVESILKDFEKRVSFELELPEDRAEGVEDCIAIHTKALLQNYVIGTIRRYRWAALKNWFENTMRFKIVSAKAIFRPEGIIGNGIILAKRADS